MCRRPIERPPLPEDVWLVRASRPRGDIQKRQHQGRRAAVALPRKDRPAHGRGQPDELLCSEPCVVTPGMAENDRRNRKLAMAHVVAQAIKDVEAERASTEARELQRQMLERASAAVQKSADAASSCEPETVSGQRPCKATRTQRKVQPRAARPVWDLEPDSGWELSFCELADRQPSLRPVELPANLVEDAFKDGLCLRRCEHGFETFGSTRPDGSEGCPFWKAETWREIGSEIVVFPGESGGIKRVDFGRMTGLLRKIGSGTFNLALALGAGDLLPRWIFQLASRIAGREVGKGNVVLRVTRQDHGSSWSCQKFQTLDQIADEARNAMEACLNGTGVEVYAVCGYHAARHGVRVRYGAIHVVDKAVHDLWHAIDSCVLREPAVKMGIAAVHLMFDLARCGIAGYDTKPGNVLQCCSPSSGFFLRLTDFDPCFYIKAPGRSWQSLFLLNLTLLSAHVRNMAPSTATLGFMDAARPVLLELVRNKHKFACDWLFGARCVEVDFEYIRGSTDFVLQRMLSCVATSYFFGKRVRDSEAPPPSTQFCWDRSGQDELRKHWQIELLRESWPTTWSREFKPLITQMVEFATS